MQAASQLIELLITQTDTRPVIEPSAPTTPRWSQNPLQSPLHAPICGPGDELDDDEAYFLGEDDDDDEDIFDDDDDDLDEDLDDDDDDLDDDVNLDEEDF